LQGIRAGEQKDCQYLGEGGGKGGGGELKRKKRRGGEVEEVKEGDLEHTRLFSRFCSTRLPRQETVQMGIEGRGQLAGPGTKKTARLKRY